MGIKSLSRRHLLNTTGIVGAAAYLGSAKALADCLVRTPPQTEGPFYPVEAQEDEDSDLTRLVGHEVSALGEKVIVSGSVINACTQKPIAGALVEIWQACASGRYNHPQDTNTAALDPHFQYWGRVTTDAHGAYSFRTIKPGAYPASSTWMRPPHIHVRVVAPGLPPLTTQLYFAGEKLNDKDSILLAVPKAQRQLVIVDFVQAEGQEEKIGTFDIILQPKLSERTSDLTATPMLD